MKFVPYNMENLKGIRAAGYLMEFIEGFVASEHRCVSVQDYPHKTVNACASALRRAIVETNHHHVKVMVRNGNVFLINTAIE